MATVGDHQAEAAVDILEASSSSWAGSFLRDLMIVSSSFVSTTLTVLWPR